MEPTERLRLIRDAERNWLAQGPEASGLLECGAGEPTEVYPTMAQQFLDALTVTGVAVFDPINKPAHYNHGAIQTIDVIEDWKLNYHLGNVVKYISRADHKGDPLESLRKAAWYLNREIERRERGE